MSEFLPERFADRIKAMFRFGLTSALATVVDFLLFSFLFIDLMLIFYAEISAAFCGMVINFFMQKRFVFDLQRKAYAAFFLSLGFSFVVMFLGAFLIQFLTDNWFAEMIIAAKLIVIGFKFALNFFSKRWVFERKIFRR